MKSKLERGGSANTIRKKRDEKEKAEDDATVINSTIKWISEKFGEELVRNAMAMAKTIEEHAKSRE